MIWNSFKFTKKEEEKEIQIEEVFAYAFITLFEFNRQEDIEPEQYRKNIETMIKLHQYIEKM
ncbi:hypothetical protein ACTFRP_19490 [Bacillus cereus group sp. MYBK234-1]|uniref:hypothetical protein n=1 Tax=unclassified Bacillus cereus group TaxID=2750818 RepID=UPI003F7AF986